MLTRFVAVVDLITKIAPAQKHRTATSPRRLSRVEDGNPLRCGLSRLLLLKDTASLDWRGTQGVVIETPRSFISACMTVMLCAFRAIRINNRSRRSNEHDTPRRKVWHPKFKTETLTCLNLAADRVDSFAVALVAYVGT